MKPDTLHSLVCAGLLALAGLAPVHAQGDSEILKKQTVQIEVYRGGQSQPEHGSGVILCQKDDLTYVLSAYHVLFGESYGGRRPTRNDIDRTVIDFYNNVADRVVEDRTKDEDRITVYTVKEKDLLLMVFEVPTELPADAEPGQVPSPIGTDHAVRAVGYAARSATPWDEREGTLLRRDEGSLFHSAPIEKGFSGGPLFDESGALIGIDVEIPTNSADTRDKGRAVPIDEVKKSIDRWIPADCLAGAGEEDTDKTASELYKTAVREISVKNWPEAEKLLKQVLDLKPTEGGSVHLQGMRYTVYLPHYHLGLALYKQGKYRKAYLSLATSETQGAIRDDKRYRKLKKLKEEARQRKNQETAPAAW